MYAMLPLRATPVSALSDTPRPRPAQSRESAHCKSTLHANMDSNSNSGDMLWLKLENEDDDMILKRDTRLKWNTESTMKLIELFERECKELWDVKHLLYKDRNARLRKHEYLANELGTTVEEIIRKLHNMRSQFNNEVRKIKKKQNLSDGSLQGASGWEYFDLLLFLRNPNDPIETTLPMEAVNIELAEFQAEEELEFGAAARARQSSSNSPPRTRKSMARVAASAPPPLPASAHPMMWPDSPLPKIKPGLNADECQIFGDFVASELRTLRSDESRKRLKRIIQKAILKIGEEEDVNIISG